jgi:hypothetical protein
MSSTTSLTPDELRCRLRGDYAICRRMFGAIFAGEAYRSTADLEQRRQPITTDAEGHLATKYRVDFRVKTLIGPDVYADVTTIGFDLDRPAYPFEAPYAWIISSHVPYSPHFTGGQNWQVCIGSIWSNAEGTMLLGQLFVHIAKLLNWEEVEFSPGYAGWNLAAIDYHRRVYGGRPITAGLRYPTVPADLLERLGAGTAPAEEESLFRARPGAAHAPDAALFAPRGVRLRGAG